MNKLILAISIFFLIGAPAMADSPCQPLLNELNRPNLGYGACTAPKGDVIIELGYQNTDGKNVQYPQGFLRYGLTDKLEFDVIGPNFNRAYGVSGLSDSGVGVSYQLYQNDKLQLGVNALYTSPNGKSEFSNGKGVTTFNVNAAYSLTNNLSISGTLASSSLGFNPSVTLAEGLGKNNQIYAEYYAGPRALYDYGWQHIINSNVIIDAELGKCKDGTPYTGAGLSFRL